MTQRPISGFTLIELSIVLVVIGLIVGGVLVGQDLIISATLRAQIAQIEKYNSAVNTFRGKYNDQLPGDMDANTASVFGFAPRPTGAGCTLAACRAQGDGNGIIEGFGNWGGVMGPNEQYGETVMFWVELTTANGLNLNFIDGGGFSAGSFTTGSLLSSTNLPKYFPQAKIGQGNYVYAISGGDYIAPNNGYSQVNGINYFAITQLTDNNPGDTKFSISVQQAYNIDKKMDDGFPETGHVLGSILYAPAAGVTSAATDNAGTCYNTSITSGMYSTAYKNGSGANCGLLFQFQ